MTMAGAAVTATWVCTTLVGVGLREEQCHCKDGARKSWPDWKHRTKCDGMEPPGHFQAVLAEHSEGTVVRYRVVGGLDMALSP